ncbi:phytoene desaturase family protein [Phytohabitans rumicis]|uniref:C-3',4' desaturase CrtD n=1 Tax=Phytohabitans rumicis TaxID=1076125 RepID=A0A6V8LFD2_9ACTN|nr:NAD(P)/FAD-dependent oxidoreductase [Phytohabitans rumicis]GFJ93541.1 C-3',4' desaturase CrtD [Phytohabitans rumicis]
MFRTNVQNTSLRGRVAVPARADVAVVGGGLAGMATALRLQAAGLSTVVIEAHGHAGGCAGYWRHKGFSFDVGATTLVDFAPGGVGAEFLDSVGAPPPEGEHLPGYVAWLPDRAVTLHRDPTRWQAERLAAFGETPGHRAFWRELDTLADVFWRASRAGIRMPLRRPSDVVHNLRAVGLRHAPLARHLTGTLGGALHRHGLGRDTALRAVLGMLIEDTVHSSVQRAPLINAALGITIRGAGLTRHEGGMHGFWRTVVGHYRALGGQLRTGTIARTVTGRPGAYTVMTNRGVTTAAQVVLAVPAQVTATVCGGLPVARRLVSYLDRDRDGLGGAIVVFLGVPDEEVACHAFTHHQLLQDYAQPFGDGNNMFVSVSAAGDTLSAPPGHRAVMISTHTSLSAWSAHDSNRYAQRKKEIGEHLVALARRVYPRLGERAAVFDVGTPQAYERFAFRPGGAVGGPRQTLRNSNQFAVPHDLGGPGLWLVGDSTWPGLGTVACVLGSRIVADGILRERRRTRPEGAPR